MNVGTPPASTVRLRRLDRVFGAALAALTVPAIATTATPADAQEPVFSPPARPLVLTREVRRTMADGQQLTVRRRYMVQFHAHPGGFTVSGELTGVEVEAPANMAELAEVERRRPDTGLFPLELNANGLIIARPAPTESVDAARAREAITAYLARTDLTGPERAEAQSMALKLQAAAQTAGNSWPPDLFRPTPGQRQEERALALPDGQAGRVSVTVDASGAEGGLLAKMERRVVTRLAGSERLSIERWSLAKAR